MQTTDAVFRARAAVICRPSGFSAASPDGTGGNAGRQTVAHRELPAVLQFVRGTLVYIIIQPV